MEAEDYKTLLKQAEDELGATPGAYCSRKAAIRAMELLREIGQREFDVVEKDKQQAQVEARLLEKTMREQAKTIGRQAQAIKDLQRQRVEQPGLLQQIKRNTNQAYIGSGDNIKKMFMNPEQFIDINNPDLMFLRERADDKQNPWKQI